MRFGMLGCAHVHAPGYARAVAALPGAELVAIADRDPSRLAEAVGAFGGVGCPDHGDLPARPDVDAVIVMAETAFHEEPVVDAAAAGKHVLCEKPIATTRADGAAMVAACRAAGVAMGTIFPLRFSPSARALRGLLRDGAIGAPPAVRATNPGQAPPGWFRDPVLAGGGAVMDHVVHVADLLRWRFATEVVEVYAEAATRLRPGLPVDDVGVLLPRLANGPTASPAASWSRPRSWPTWGGLTLAVVGERGVAALDPFAERLRLADDRAARCSSVPWGTGLDFALLRGFVEAVTAGSYPPMTGEDGLRALEVALCAYASAREGEPVPCPDGASP